MDSDLWVSENFAKCCHNLFYVIADKCTYVNFGSKNAEVDTYKVGICALYLATSVHSKVICIIPYWERLGEGHSGFIFNSQTVECYA